MTPGADPDPLLVEVLRGDMVESAHRGSCAVVDARGGIVLSLGDIDRPVYPRSAIKPLQALPLIESGAADRYGLSPKEIALACASHRGEPMHVEAVNHWLAHLGLSDHDLECGTHMPGNAAAAEALIRAGVAPCPLHNNCSGKHTGFLTTALHLGEPTRGYIGADHPVQRRLRVVLEEMTDLKLDQAPSGIDGCGIPVLGIPLRGMALAMARLADPTGLPPERAKAASRILDAMAAEPLMVSGTGTFTSEVMTAAQAVRIKPGAEGVFCAALPGRGLGVALKIDDGAARASEVAIGAILSRLGAFDENLTQRLSSHLRPSLVNVAGRTVGELRPARF